MCIYRIYDTSDLLQNDQKTGVERAPDRRLSMFHNYLIVGDEHIRVKLFLSGTYHYTLKKVKL